MTKADSKSVSDTPRAASPRDDANQSAWPMTAGGALLISLAALRPMLGEVFAHHQFSLAPSAAGGLTPGTTVALDALTLIGAALVFAACAPRRSLLAGLSLAGLVIAVGVSVVAAGDRAVALIAGMNIVVAVIGGVALCVVARDPRVALLLAAAVLATGITAAARATLWYDDTGTRAEWERQKTTLIERGIPADDPTLVNFERRLHSTRISGFQAHPNVAAGLIGATLPLVVVALGGIYRHWGRAGPSRMPALLAGAALLAGGLLIPLTLLRAGSAGALIAGVAGITCLTLLRLAWRQRWRPQRSVALILGPYLGLIGVGIGIGITQGTLPERSLSFRWAYWSAGLSAYLDVPLTGVGRENFRDAYLQHRAPQFSEDVANAHNLWVSSLVELGPVGLISVAGLLLFGMLRGVHSAAAADNLPRPDASRARRYPLGAMTFVVVSFVLGGSFLLSDRLSAAVASPQPDVFAVLLILSIEVAMVWGIAFWAARCALTEIASPARAAAGVAGLVSLLIHNLVGFSLFQPAGVALCAAMVALAARSRDRAPETHAAIGSSSEVVHHATDPPQRDRGLPALGGGMIVMACAMVIFVARPAWQSSAALQRASQAPASLEDLHAIRDALTRATIAEPLNPDPPRALAGVMATSASWFAEPGAQIEAVMLARKAADTALARNRKSAPAHALAAQVRMPISLEQELIEADQLPDLNAGAWAPALQRWDEAVARSPFDLRLNFDAFRAHAWCYHTTADEGCRSRARALLAHLREIDTARETADPNRLTADQRTSLEEWEQLLNADPPPGAVSE